MQKEKPKASSGFAQRELDKAEKQFEKFDNDIKEMTLDRMNAAPKAEQDSEPKISQKEVRNANDIYLKHKRALAPGVDPKTGKIEKFNESFRSDWEFKKEYVKFMAENKEIGGENITMWTKPFPGVEAEEWEVPVNKPIWGPRYLADQIKRKYYHRLVMKDTQTHSDGTAQYYGTMSADTTIQRLDAHPVSDRSSVFMGKSSF